MHVFSFFWLEAGNYSILRQLASIKTTISDNYFFLNKNTLRLRLLQKYLKIRTIICFCPKECSTLH